MNGAPKPVVTGRKGNVGGISTPGRHGNHGAAMMAGVKNLVAPGPGTKKTAAVQNLTRPEGKVGSLQQMAMTSKSKVSKAAGSPKDISAGSGHKGIHVGTRPEPPVKRDSESVIKPHKV